MLWGWVNYFALGHSSECFSYIKDWVEKKVRRHLAQARKQEGFNWERWSSPWLYDTLNLFNGYRARRDGPKAALAVLGPISLKVKQMGARSAGNLHAASRRGGDWKRGTVEIV
jgi:Group II intron, maturase-specific domain